MSAIAGVYLLDGSSLDQNDLKRMNDRLSHRGPDGSGIWAEGSVGFAHQMLWNTPESLRERLPLEADGLVITSDARIDNREELLPAIGLSEHVSDSEVILEAYRKWGQDCVDHLLGDFAFAIWDKARGELFCARDHMGVKPFYYYYQSGEIFAFATEIKALFAWGVPQGINEVRIGDYLASILEDKEITFYEGILRLPPAHVMVVGLDSLTTDLYWELDSKSEIRLGSDEEYARAFRNIFSEAVRCRLRSAFPIGSMLSGGLDSSSVVCMARERLPKGQRLKTFSAIFDTVKECDERVYINSVLSKSDIEPYFIYADKIGPLYDIDKVMWHEDQPFYAGNLYIFWAVYEKAHNKGVRVILDGYDGDTTVSHGKGYITELTGRGRLVSALREVRRLSKKSNRSPWKIFLQHSIYPFVPTYMRELRHRIYGINEDPLVGVKIIEQGFARRIDLLGRKKALQFQRSMPARTVRENHWRKLTWGVHQLVFEISDIAAAAFSIEPRHPFFDKRLVEYCLALPADQKIRYGWTRWIMRNALRDILPEDIYLRSGKTGQSPGFLHGLLVLHREVLEDLAFNSRCSLDSYVSLSTLHECYQRCTSGIGNYNDDASSLWNAVTLALWLRG